MKKKTISAISITLFIACSIACNKPNNVIVNFSWLEGKWEGNLGEMKTFTEWEPIKNNQMNGFAGIYSAEDTLFSEKIKFELIDDELNYIAMMKDSANRFVAFKLIKSENDSATFENLQNEYPQRVIYLKKSDGTLYIQIEGRRSGGQGKQVFDFKKVK